MPNQLWFTSSFFRVDAGEDEETNPGRYGKALALWLSEQLRQRRVPVEGVVPEDFGWVIVVSRKPSLLWIGCGNEDGSENRWGVFVTAERGLLQRISGSADPSPTVAELEAHLTEIVRRIPDAEEIGWES